MNNPASQLKGMELVAWLDNKLGNPNELWCGRQASSVLSREILNELAGCFQALESHVKLKIIEAIPHLSPKLIQMWRVPLTNLLEIAQDDADNWVRTIAKMYLPFPNTGAIKCDISDTDKQFEEAVQEFQRILDTTQIECNVIPPDSLIATPPAVQMAFGYSSLEPQKHFKLKKPLKAEQTLQDALRLAQNTQNQVKRTAPGVTSSLPIRVRSTIRKPDNNLPMRGIPSVPVSRIASGFSNEPRKFQRNMPKREGGAMLIDISDLPQAPNMKKRRGPAAPKTPKEVDPAKEPKKKSGGKKAKNQEPATPTDQPQFSDPNQMMPVNDANQEHQQRQQEEELMEIQPQSTLNPFAPPNMQPMMMGARKLDNVMNGAFSFI
ncbi:HDAg domain-containing protein [Aphelenchoides bicaudatus]|nr:HDAg domain-containing protein [Aphelenchoides bicaudatus]